MPAHSPPGRSSWLMHLSTLEVSQQSVTPKLSRGFYVGGFSRHHSGWGRAFALQHGCSNRIALISGSQPVSSRAAAMSLSRHDPCPKGAGIVPWPGFPGLAAFKVSSRTTVQLEWTQRHFTPQAFTQVAGTPGPRTTQASFLRTWLSRSGNMKHPGWLGVGYRPAGRSLPSVIRQLK